VATEEFIQCMWLNTAKPSAAECTPSLAWSDLQKKQLIEIASSCSI